MLRAIAGSYAAMLVLGACTSAMPAGDGGLSTSGATGGATGGSTSGVSTTGGSTSSGGAFNQIQHVFIIFQGEIARSITISGHSRARMAFHLSPTAALLPSQAARWRPLRRHLP